MYGAWSPPSMDRHTARLANAETRNISHKANWINKSLGCKVEFKKCSKSFENVNPTFT